MKDIEHLYGAYIRFPKVSGKIEFKYSEMEIKNRHDRCIETTHPYFTSRDYSTSYFGKDMLNKDLKITDELTVFYSESKERCITWLTDEREKLYKSCEYDFMRLKDSKVEEKIEEC